MALSLAPASSSCGVTAGECLLRQGHPCPHLKPQGSRVASALAAFPAVGRRVVAFLGKHVRGCRRSWHLVLCSVPISSGIKVSLLRTSVLWTFSLFPSPNVLFLREVCFLPKQPSLPSSFTLTVPGGGEEFQVRQGPVDESGSWVIHCTWPLRDLSRTHLGPGEYKP